MTSGIMNGSLVGIYVNGSTKVANCVTSEFSVSMAVRDTTNKDNAGWKTGLGGVKSWSGSCSGMFDQSANYTYDQLFALIEARTAITLYFSTTVTGDKKYSGSALITSLKKTFPSEENVTFEMSFEGTGALTESIL